MDVAVAAGLRNRMSVYQWESLTHPDVPTKTQLQKIAKFLNVKVEVFYKEITVEFRQLFESDLEAFCLRIFGDSNAEHHDKRLAIEIWKHLCPEPLPIDTDNDKPQKVQYDPLKDMVNANPETTVDNADES